MVKRHFFIVQHMKNDQYFLLTASQKHQIFRVLRLKSGDDIVCIYQQGHYLTKIIGSYEDALFLKLKLLLSHQNTNKIILITAIIKPKGQKIMIQKASELGVNCIVPWISQRSVVVRGIDQQKIVSIWQKIANEATEQAQRLKLCLVQPICATRKDLMQYQQQINFFLTPQADVTLWALLKKFLINQHDHQITIVVGPEGGLTQDECQWFTQHKFLPVNLGKAIFRSETAAIYTLSVVHEWLLNQS